MSGMAGMTACPMALRQLFRMSYVFAVLVLFFGWVPAWAADYTFPGNLPAGCAGSGGSYTCGALTLAPGDTISVASPTTIIVNGALTTGAGCRINAGGTASDLSLAVMGTTDLGANNIVNANVMGAGVVTVGTLGKFTGNIQTQSAAINIGDFTTVNGSLVTTVAGVVNVGANSHIAGSIGTLSGAINIGAASTIDGSVASTLAGVVTLGAGAIVKGNVNTVSGAINLGASSNVFGFLLSSVAGAVTIGSKAAVGGGIGTQSGAITIAVGSSAGGSVCTGLAGAVTLNDNSVVGGNVSTNAGAITVGDSSKVAGAVTAAVGAVTVAPSANVGTVASKLGCPLDVAVATTPRSAPVIKSREWRQIFMR